MENIFKSIKYFSRYDFFCVKKYFSKNNLQTDLILMRIYLSGMSPSLPPTQPRHQSELAWLYSTMLSPFMKLTCSIVIINIISRIIITIISPLAMT